jgi:dTMP kinase
MFITFEGIDGCGKTTQLNLLKKYLIENNFDVITTREPGGTELSEQIRNILLGVSNVINPITELLLFEAARSHLVATVIKPALNKNAIVLSDRFFDSTFAYQGYGRGLCLEQINYLNNLAVNGVIPTLTFFLDIPFEVSLERRHHKEVDRMEGIGYDFFNSVINGFRRIAELEPQRVITIDATQTKENTFNQIIKTVVQKL